MQKKKKRIEIQGLGQFCGRFFTCISIKSKNLSMIATEKLFFLPLKTIDRSSSRQPPIFRVSIYDDLSSPRR